MAVEIDALNLERAITGLAGKLGETSEDLEGMGVSLANISESLESIDESLKKIAAAAEQPKRRSRKRALKAVGT